MSEKQAMNTKKSNKALVALAIFWPLFFLWMSFNNQQHDERSQHFFDESRELTRQLIFEKRELEKQLYILRCEEYEAIQLMGTDKYPTANVVVYYNSAKQSCYLDVRVLPALTGNKQYQVWAVVGEAYTAMCTFDRKEEVAEMLPMTYIPKAKHFMVSVEPNSGSDEPTLSAVVCD